LKSAGHQSRLLGGAFGYRSANMLSIPFRGNGAVKISEVKLIASGFLNIFWMRKFGSGAPEIVVY